MTQQKQLNKAELFGLQVAERDLQQAQMALQAAEQHRNQLFAAVGLVPGLPYQIGPDGVVHFPAASGQPGPTALEAPATEPVVPPPSAPSPIPVNRAARRRAGKA